MQAFSIQVKSIILMVMLTGVSMTGCATQSVEPQRLETIHSVSVASGSLTIGVSSNGCTKKESFKVHVVQGEPAYITIERIKYDGCKRMRHLVNISFPLEELGVDSSDTIVVENPLKAFKKVGFAKPRKTDS